MEELHLHCSCPPVHEARFDPETGSTPTGAVVEALATAANVDPIDLPPLNQSIDPDALDSLFERTDESEANGMVLGFTVDGWNVFLRGDGLIRVCDPAEEDGTSPLFGTTDVARTD